MQALSEQQNKLLEQLYAISDLQFATLPPFQQLDLMRSLHLQTVDKGEVIIREGDRGGSLYFLLGPKAAQVEVVVARDGMCLYCTALFLFYASFV